MSGDAAFLVGVLVGGVLGYLVGYGMGYATAQFRQAVTSVRGALGDLRSQRGVRQDTLGRIVSWGVVVAALVVVGLWLLSRSA